MAHKRLISDENKESDESESVSEPQHSISGFTGITPGEKFCARQGWTLPQLLLILPPERDTSEQSLMKLSGREHITFVSTAQLSANSVLSWLHGRILSRVEPIQDVKQLEEVWLNTTHIQEKKHISPCYSEYNDVVFNML
ncbi:hypothetical protein E2C01_044046 [Portunus trituberculatus]|uniref:Uncharacterized protein n=1 Tax=Portunus trituberculatus TaxID=210409 RepID=A0A5B7FYW7_PORTR|nr:hypothetical protein [Portunus trituberculatus]